MPPQMVTSRLLTAMVPRATRSITLGPPLNAWRKNARSAPLALAPKYSGYPSQPDDSSADADAAVLPAENILKRFHGSVMRHKAALGLRLIRIALVLGERPPIGELLAPVIEIDPLSALQRLPGCLDDGRFHCAGGTE